jgi:hypothetical protein
MDYHTFRQLCVSRLPPATVLLNPGGGVSTIVRYSAGKVVYRRLHSLIYVSLHDLYEAWRAFGGGVVSSSDLKEYAPSTFDSKAGGHSCNCTMLFMILRALGVVSRIEGGGVRGDPFWVLLPPA